MRNFVAFIVAVIFTACSSDQPEKVPPHSVTFLDGYYSSYLVAEKNYKGDKKLLFKEKVEIPVTAMMPAWYLFADTALPNSSELLRIAAALAENQDVILQKIRASIKKCSAYLQNSNLEIFVAPNYIFPFVRKRMSGIMGETTDGSHIILYVDPTIAGWDQMFEYTLAHEFNHSCCLKEKGSPYPNLLDKLVLEGKADAFAELVYPGIKAPWTQAINEKQKKELWPKLKPLLSSTSIDLYRQVMFGSGDYPIWTGYTLGYELVQSALKKKPELTPEQWIKLSPKDILEMSGHNPL